MSNVKPIDQVLFDFENICKSQPTTSQTIKFELEKLVRKVYSDAINQPTGWCMSFKIPETDVLNLLESSGVDQKRLSAAFLTQWNVPASAHMVNNPYYHALIFFSIYGIRHRNDDIVKHCMTLLLIKIWNGRRQKHIKYCDPDVFRYVIANMSGKYLLRKFDSPMLLIMNHFVPTLISTYGAKINQDSTVTKRLFDQSWGRVRQLFVSDMSPNIKTGRSEARSGIAPLYYDAKKKGLKISTSKSTSTMNIDDDNESSTIDNYTTHSHDELIANISNYMMMNIQPKYDPAFIRFINRETSAKAEKILILLNSIHSVRYNDFIRDMLELMFNQLKLGDKTDICGQDFFLTLKKKIISSKHSPNVTQLKNVADLLLERIFDDKIKYVSYSSYSIPMCGKLRNIIFYGFGYNIQKYICSN